MLAITSASTDNTPEFTIDIDDTVAAGDSIRLQIQVALGNWSSPVSDTTHTITSGEDSANEIDLSLGALSNGNYEARAYAASSPASNTVSFTIAATSNVFLSMDMSDFRNTYILLN